MNFNKDYPIAILDTNIAITVPNILNILKGCNIVIPYTLIDKLDKVKKENVYGVRDFVNNFLALSEKANLSKDGYKLENDCMLYLDIDKNNSYHKDINLDSKKQDIKFVAEAKNLKEKYNDMEVVLISSDKIIKITASIFDVKVKFLEEFITEYLKEEFKLNILFDLLVESKHYYDEYIKRVAKYIAINISENYYRVSEIIFKIVSDNKDIDGLYKLSESYNPNEEVYKKIFEILSEAEDLEGLFKLDEIYDYEEIYEKIFEILSEAEDLEGLFKLDEIYDYEEIYEKIFEILSKNRDIDGLYKLSEIYKDTKIYEEISNILANDKNINGLYELAKYYNNAYNKIFTILSENKDIDGLYKLSESYNPDKKIYEGISNILANDKNINGLYELTKYYGGAYYEIFNILAENKDIDGLYKLSESYNPNEEVYKKISNILVKNKDTKGLYKLAENILKLVNKPKEEIYRVYKKYKDYKKNRYYYNSYDKEETIRGIKEFKIDILENIYNKIFAILAENKDAKGLVELLKNEYVTIFEFEWFGLDDDKKYNSVELICITKSRIFNTLLESKNVSKLLELAEVENNYIEHIKNNQNNYMNNNIIKNFEREISEIYNKSFEILSENKDIDGLYKLYEIYKYEEIYKEISNILAENKDIDGLYKLYEIYKYEEIYKKIFEILSEAEDLEGLFKLAGKYNKEAIYKKICEILDKEEDKNKLYELTKNKDIKNLLSNSSHPKINEIMLKMLIDKIEELEN